MRFLRDFYFGLSWRDRAIIWVTIALGLAIGFGSTAIATRRQPADAAAPALTAPPIGMRIASAVP